MKKLFTALIIFLFAFCSLLNADDENLDTIVSGTWEIYGQGFGEKGFVRLQLGLEGEMELETKRVGDLEDKILVDGNSPVLKLLVSEDMKALTSYDINVKLSITGAAIKVWDENIPNSIQVPVLLPKVHPTVDEPFVLPTITYNKISYTLKFTSNSSGVLRVQGYVDVDTIGECEIKADCTVWKSGTQMPVLDSSTKSGCNSGINLFALVLIFFGGRKFVWN